MKMIAFLDGLIIWTNRSPIVIYSKQSYITYSIPITIIMILGGTCKKCFSHYYGVLTLLNQWWKNL